MKRHICLVGLLISFSVFISFAGPHTVQRGETYSSIAALYDINEDTLKTFNRNIELYTGYTIDTPVTFHLIDVADNDLFLNFKRNFNYPRSYGKSDYEAAMKMKNKLYKVSGEKYDEKDTKIFDKLMRAVEKGNVDATYEIGCRLIHGDFTNYAVGFNLKYNQDLYQFYEGLEYLQVAALCGKNKQAFIQLALASGNKNSPIYNPFICETLLENYLKVSYDGVVSSLLYDMNMGDKGIGRNLLNAYIYCPDNEFAGTSEKSRREKILNMIDEIDKNSYEGIKYGGILNDTAMLGMASKFYDGKIFQPEGIYWVHMAAHKGNGEANWMMAQIISSEIYTGIRKPNESNRDNEVLIFARRAAARGVKDAQTFIKNYEEWERQKRLKEIAEYERRERERQYRKQQRAQMWTNVVSNVLNLASGMLNSYLNNKYQTTHQNYTNTPYIKPNSALNTDFQKGCMQLMQYTYNKVISDWYGVPMPYTDLSAVNLGSDFSPGSPQWMWSQQQQINTMATQNARMSWERIAFLKRQTFEMEQALMNNTQTWVNELKEYLSNYKWEFNYDSTYDYSGFNETGYTGYYGGSYDLNYDDEPKTGVRKKRSSYYQDRYGYKRCSQCGGSGKCRSCYNGYINNGFGESGKRECPNCFKQGGRSTGLCRSCQGTGQQYGVM